MTVKKAELPNRQISSSKERKISIKSSTKQKKVGTTSHRKVNAAKPSMKVSEKPKLKPSKSDLSEIDQRKISTFSSDSDRVRNLSSSDGMLVVRKRSVWARLNDPITTCDFDEENPPEPQLVTNESVKKRKHGIVPFIPSFRSDIMSVFRSANTRRKNKDQNDSTKHSPPKDSLLRKAVRRSDIERVRKLLTTNKDININATNIRGITALHEAAIDGNCPMLKLLIEFGADINVEDNEGYNALDYAVCGGDFECASHLVNSGASEARVRNGLIGFAT